MSNPAKINFKVTQGGTFKQTLRWESSTKVYAPITGISNTAPVVITAPSHGAPEGWRVKITNVGGMKELNSVDKYHTATGTTTNTVTINAINAISYTPYISGGILEYNKPIDLTGVFARMQIRLKVDSPTHILELTTTNGGLLVDSALGTITMLISNTSTAAFTFISAVYGLELVFVNGEVIPFASGNMTLVREVTR